MSGHRYIADTKNLFLDDDDVDDETFLKNSRHNYSSQPTFEEQRLSYLEKKKAIEDRTINSTERSISLLRDSEQIGIATAEELLRQREQLENTDKRLDEINATLRFSQKHINGIKSVFGSLKNYLSGRSDQNMPKSSSQHVFKAEERREQPFPEVDRFESHPITRMRGLDQEPHSQSSGSKNFSEILDQNLDEMYGSISRLKGLAEGLSTEMDSQNDLIGNITDKTERADISLGKQNKEMNRLLKK